MQTQKVGSLVEYCYSVIYCFELPEVVLFKNHFFQLSISLFASQYEKNCEFLISNTNFLNSLDTYRSLG